MKSHILPISALLLISLLLSCKGQPKKAHSSATTAEPTSSEYIQVPENGFSCGFLDSKGRIWLGSNGGGIARFDGKGFRKFSQKDGLSSDQVFAIAEDQQQNLWFGTQNGLSKYDGMQFEHIRLPYQDTSGTWLDKMYPIINPNAVHALATDNSGKLWVGTAGGGAYAYDGKNFKAYLREIGRMQEDSLHHNWIPSICQDKQGNMWFASMTHGGVNRLEGDGFAAFSIADGLSDDQVRTIFCDRSGKIWMGFNGNRASGLTVYDGLAFKTISEEDGLCNKRIHAIFEDQEGKIWLGSPRGNLCIFDGKAFSEFEFEGRKFPDVLFIVGDLEDNIWFGGRQGLWKFDGQNLWDMTKGK